MAIKIEVAGSFDDREIKRAQRELQKLATVAGESSQTITAKMARTGESFTQLGSSLTKSVTLPLVAIGTLAVKAFTEQEDAIAKMESSIESTGGVAGVTSQHIQDLAGSLQQTTTFADEVTVGAAALLLTFKQVRNEAGAGNDVFDRTIKVAQDLSAKMGTDLNSSVMQLGKALENPTAGMSKLARAGIQFTEQQKQQIRTLQESGDTLGAQKIMLDELERQFGGTAEAMGQTASGQLKRAFNQLGEAAEKLGAAIVPALTFLADKMSGFAGMLQRIPGPVMTIVAALGGLAAAAGPVIWATGSIITNLSTIASTRIGMAAIEAFKGLQSMFIAAAAQGGILGTTLTGLSGAFSFLGSLLLPSAIVIGGLALLAKGIRSAQGAAAEARLGDFAKDVETTAASLLQFKNTGSLNSAVLGFDEFSEAVINVRTELFKSQDADKQPPILKQITQLGNQFNGVYENADKARERLKNFDDALMSMSWEDAKNAADRYFNALGDGNATVEMTTDILPKFSEKLKASETLTDPAARALRGLGSAFGGVSDDVEEATSSLKDWEETIKRQFDPLWNYQDAVYDFEDAQKAVREAQIAYNEAVAQFGPNSVQAQEAMRALEEATRNEITTSGAASGAFRDLVASVVSGETPIAQAIENINGLESSHRISAEAAQIQRQALLDLASSVLGLYFPDVKIPIDSNAAQVLATIQSIQAALADLDARARNAGSITDLVLGTGNATGGPVSAGVPGMVGERGPELFIPAVDGTIVPHYQSRRIMDAMGDGGGAAPAGVVNNYSITVNGLVGRDKRDILDFLARELPKAAATSGRAFG